VLCFAGAEGDPCVLSCCAAVVLCGVQATPASDLYALGGTLLYLVSGQPPGAFPQARMRINYK